ncbi:pyruvate dehydrogenase E2 component (dihydrolipoamide acetyltransferase) [Lacibacter cauensis]|uniref:Acetyltransferase component of pyruvate dehydrogenase complex n=1 Tax=Lacibacter cauensis TaxID=510947 RepID=A0A562SRH4_9BACT|nr:pyruvate dehydrogenase complex dihydrolipoamide acetyltransferase [Lacibacter cauensis]TWI83738.1 pyruvate dehydrogenase E2 component (dihydrolipoamide acetyltransferase) [Lacibacter cauensis]
MAEVIRMPLLSDTMTEGKIVKWNKQVGDKVKSDDVLADVETDKATMEVVGYADGTLLYIGVPEGKAAQINEIIAIVGKEGEDYKSLLDGGSAAPAPAPAAATETAAPAPSAPAAAGVDADALASQLGVTVIRMPLLSDTMTEGKIVAWNKKVGDSVKADESLADVETDKATMEVVPYADGTILYTGVEAGNAAKVNEVIAVIGKAGTDITALVAAFKNPGATAAPASAPAAATPTAASAPTVATTTTSSTENGRVKASPLAKKIAAEKGIDLHAVQGSGDGGRIIKADIDNFKPAAATAPAASKAATPSAPVMAFTPGAGEGYVDTPNSNMRKTIARRLGESMFTAPHFYLKMELNMDNAMAARAQMNAVSPVKISFQDMMIKACAMALRQHPAVNSSWMGDFIRTYQHIHIGSAVAVDQGLIVPVFKFADQKSLSQIAAEANGLYDKARTGKLQPQEFSGNTFTISNLGMMDIEDFTAIINPPDSCILAVGRIKEIVIKKKDGSFGTTNVMKVTLSCDHRSVDGAIGAAFLQTLKKYIENPVTMLV